MELVEGPTLADRIGDGAISVAEAARIAIQIAEALEAARRQRDRPPRPEGQPTSRCVATARQPT